MQQGRPGASRLARGAVLEPVRWQGAARVMGRPGCMHVMKRGAGSRRVAPDPSRSPLKRAMAAADAAVRICRCAAAKSMAAWHRLHVPRGSRAESEAGLERPFLRTPGASAKGDPDSSIRASRQWHSLLPVDASRDPVLGPGSHSRCRFMRPGQGRRRSVPPCSRSRPRPRGRPRGSTAGRRRSTGTPDPAEACRRARPRGVKQSAPAGRG